MQRKTRKISSPLTRGVGCLGGKGAKGIEVQEAVRETGHGLNKNITLSQVWLSRAEKRATPGDLFTNKTERQSSAWAGSAAPDEGLPEAPVKDVAHFHAVAQPSRPGTSGLAANGLVGCLPVNKVSGSADGGRPHTDTSTPTPLLPTVQE